jgi:hypothetical protein
MKRVYVKMFIMPRLDHTGMARRWPRRFRVFAVAVSQCMVALLSASCTDSGTRDEGAARQVAASAPTPTPAPAPAPDPDPVEQQDEGLKLKVFVEQPSLLRNPDELTTEKHCTGITISAERAGKPVAGAEVSLSLPEDSDARLIVPENLSTDESGSAVAQVCSGSKATEIVVTATIDSVQVNSRAIAVADLSFQLEVTAKSSELLQNLNDSVSEPYCTDITAVIESSDIERGGKQVTFSVKDESAQSRILSASVLTDSEGKAVSRLCAGVERESVIVSASFEGREANTQPITVVASIFTFAYLDLEHSALSGFATNASESVSESAEGNVSDGAAAQASEDPILLNILGTGSDCTVLNFRVTRDGVPQSGYTAAFRTDSDIPPGVKLAGRDEPGTQEEETESGRTYATFTGTSNSSGVFEVPFCSGVVPGSARVFGELSHPDLDEPLNVVSPLIVFNTGAPNWGFLSLTLDAEKSTIANGFFNTNAEQTLSFAARIGAVRNADIDTTRPIGVMTEIGRVNLDNAGLPSADGKISFTYEAVNIGGRAPVQVNEDYDIRCNPLNFSTPTPFAQLAQNWRSKMIYYISGQEYYHDANANGVYDEGGDGFWDKNQNGKYDDGDVLTYDFGNDGFRSDGEWFIDLPTPFVDSNNNGVHDPGEAVVGGVYAAPNQKWDARTSIWKHIDIPIFMGTSPYALAHSQISSNYLDVTPAPGLIAYGQYLDRLSPNGQRGFAAYWENTHLWQDAVSEDADEQGFVRHFFAQDICGNPLPPNTTISLNLIETTSPSWGQREFSAHIWMQLADVIREPARRLLAEVTGSSSAKFGTDVSDHPAATASYPVEYELSVGECKNTCSGVLKPGFSSERRCPAQTAWFALSAGGDSRTVRIVADSVGDCSLACKDAPSGDYRAAFLNQSNPSSCQCPPGTTEDADGCKVNPDPVAAP